MEAIRKGTENDSLSGIVEADETFLPVYYKGGKSAFDDDAAGRKPRKRGGGNHKRGFSANWCACRALLTERAAH